MPNEHPVQATTIQPGDRVRVVGVDDPRIYTVERIAPPPRDYPQAGPIAFFAEGGFWRVENVRIATDA
jgi:hypothetical protein